jgi:hypothetical protein
MPKMPKVKGVVLSERIRAMELMGGPGIFIKASKLQKLPATKSFIRIKSTLTLGTLSTLGTLGALGTLTHFRHFSSIGKLFITRFKWA